MRKYLANTKTLRNQAIIEAYYYHLYGTLQEIGIVYNVSKQRTSEIIMRYRQRIIAYHRRFPEATPAQIANLWNVQLPETIVEMILQEHHNTPES